MCQAQPSGGARMCLKQRITARIRFTVSFQSVLVTHVTSSPLILKMQVTRAFSAPTAQAHAPP